MFPPSKSPTGAPPPRGLRDIRKSVGLASQVPDAPPDGDVAHVSMTCPSCGAAIDKTFKAADADDAGAPSGPSSLPPPAPGGGSGGGPMGPGGGA